MTGPSLGGVPDRVRLSDWLLVEWVATAEKGAPFPEPWSYAHSPAQSMVHQLVELGVMQRPAPGTDAATVARDATEAAKVWLEQHPRPEPEADTPSAAASRGRPGGI